MILTDRQTDSKVIYLTLRSDEVRSINGPEQDVGGSNSLTFRAKSTENYINRGTGRYTALVLP